MVETCYSRGKKIILLPEQKRNETWRCRFAIPGLPESDIGRSHNATLEGHKTEWEAKTAACEAATRVLDASPETRLTSAPGRV